MDGTATMLQVVRCQVSDRDAGAHVLYVGLGRQLYMLEPRRAPCRGWWHGVAQVKAKQ